MPITCEVSLRHMDISMKIVDVKQPESCSNYLDNLEVIQAEIVDTSEHKPNISDDNDECTAADMRGGPSENYQSNYHNKHSQALGLYQVWNP